MKSAKALLTAIVAVFSFSFVNADANANDGYGGSPGYIPCNGNPQGCYNDQEYQQWVAWVRENERKNELCRRSYNSSYNSITGLCYNGARP